MKRTRTRFRDVDTAAAGIAPPGAPTIGTATAGNAQATVTFTAPGSQGGGPITGYRATSTPGGITATGAASPITVTGLTNGTAYTFTVAAQNAGGFGPESAASNSVTPVANLVANGDFSTDTVWTKGSGWSIGSGVATNTGPGGADLRQTIAITSGVNYSVQYTIVSIGPSGLLDVLLGGAAGTRRSTAGTFTQTITAGSVDTMIIFRSPGTGGVDIQIDNVTVIPA
jgi:hypothetical protein